MSHKICVAKILTAHGVRGEVKLKSFMEDETFFQKIVFFHDKNNEKLFTPSGLRGKKGDVYIASFKEINDRDYALQCKGTELYIDRDLLPEIEGENEYYIEDLVGISVFLNDTPDTPFGIVKAMHNFGAGDIIEIVQADTKQVHTFPFVETVITLVDIDDNKILLQIPEVDFARDEDGEGAS